MTVMTIQVILKFQYWNNSAMKVHFRIALTHLTSHSKHKMKFATITLFSLLVNQNPICHAEEGVKEGTICIQPPLVKCRLLKI